jgi:putative CocE/NonD family hydrolase
MATRLLNAVRVDYNVWVPTPDGVRLAADVFRPSAPCRYPVILVRTPYDKLGVAAGFDPLEAVRAGYVVVVQDARGTYGSGGTVPPVPR